jgi:acetyl esterase/lipase
MQVVYEDCQVASDAVPPAIRRTYRRTMRRTRRVVVVVVIVVVALVGVLVVGRVVRREQGRVASPASSSSALADSPRTISYGSSADQVYDVWRAENATGPAPLVVFVHGGGWTNGSKDSASGPYKSTHFPRQGYAYASINYRLVPEVTVEDEARDVATAVASLIGHADELGIDPTRVVIMGHSAGAHLVALVGTDETYLRSAGLTESSLRGVIAVDGAAYDVPQQIAFGGVMHDRYLEAFGTDPARQTALSPTFQVAAPNAPAFLLPHVQRVDGIAQADELAAALNAAGTPTETASFPGTGLAGHAEINRRLGDPTYEETAVVDAWLAKVFA